MHNLFLFSKLFFPFFSLFDKRWSFQVSNNSWVCANILRVGLVNPRVFSVIHWFDSGWGIPTVIFVRPFSLDGTDSLEKALPFPCLDIIGCQGAYKDLSWRRESGRGRCFTLGVWSLVAVWLCGSGFFQVREPWFFFFSFLGNEPLLSYQRTEEQWPHFEVQGKRYSSLTVQKGL